MPILFDPLDAVQMGGDISRGITRKVTQVAVPGGLFRAHAHAPGPVGSHPIHLELTSVEEIDAFWAWYDSVLGACQPFWMPTYQRDFVPLGTIGAADVVFAIQDRKYVDLEFPDVNRRNLGFVLSSGVILKRQITAAISNGDGTESITINASLGQSFTQRRSNGICYLLYGRLSDDAVKMDWWSHDQASVDLTMIEIRGAPLTGSVL